MKSIKELRNEINESKKNKTLGKGGPGYSTVSPSMVKDIISRYKKGKLDKIPIALVRFIEFANLSMSRLKPIEQDRIDSLVTAGIVDRKQGRYVLSKDVKKIIGESKQEDLIEAKLSPDQRKRLDGLIGDVIDVTDPFYLGLGIPGNNVDLEKTLETIESEFGKEVRDSVENGIDIWHYGRENRADGDDPLDNIFHRRGKGRITKKGKLNKQDAESLKKSIKKNLKSSSLGIQKLKKAVKQNKSRFAESKQEDIADLKALLKNPDPKVAKNYGGIEGYKKMIQSKIDKLMKESTQSAKMTSKEEAQLAKEVGEIVGDDIKKRAWELHQRHIPYKQKFRPQDIKSLIRDINQWMKLHKNRIGLFHIPSREEYWSLRVIKKNLKELLKKEETELEEAQETDKITTTISDKIIQRQYDTWVYILKVSLKTGRWSLYERRKMLSPGRLSSLDRTIKPFETGTGGEKAGMKRLDAATLPLDEAQKYDPDLFMVVGIESDGTRKTLAKDKGFSAPNKLVRTAQKYQNDPKYVEVIVRSMRPGDIWWSSKSKKESTELGENKHDKETQQYWMFAVMAPDHITKWNPEKTLLIWKGFGDYSRILKTAEDVLAEYAPHIDLIHLAKAGSNNTPIVMQTLGSVLDAPGTRPGLTVKRLSKGMKVVKLPPRNKLKKESTELGENKRNIPDDYIDFMDDDKSWIAVKAKNSGEDTVRGEIAKKNWPTGAPVTRTFAKGTAQIPDGEFWVIVAKKYWYWKQDNGKWAALPRKGATPPFDY